MAIKPTGAEPIIGLAGNNAASATNRSLPAYVRVDSCASHQHSIANQALTQSTLLQRRTFETKLKQDIVGFNNRWIDFKRELFSRAIKLDESDLEAYFKKFKSSLSGDQEVEMKERLAKEGAQSFDDLDREGKIRIIGSFDRPGSNNPLHLAFKALDKNTQNRLVLAYLGYYGKKDCLAILPREFQRQAMGYISDRLKAFTDREKKNGFHFLGSGAIGTAFEYGYGQNTVCVKVPMGPEGSDFHQAFQYEEQQIKALESNRRPERESHPEEYFAPIQCKGLDGDNLGITGQAMVTELRDGEFLFKFDTAMHFIADDKYFVDGLDNQFVVDFIDFYMRNAKAGVDLGDIYHNNMLYKPGYFQLIETAAIDNDYFKELTEFRTQHTEAFLLKTLTSSIFLLSGYGPEASIEMANILRDIENFNPDKSKSSEELLNEFRSRQAEQLRICLSMACKQGYISPEQICKGIADLRKKPDSFLDTPLHIDQFETAVMKSLETHFAK